MRRQETVRAARDAYLEENGFTVEAYDAPFTDAKLWKITFKIPNTRAHRRAIMWHDLHHAVTGYGTDLAGEGEISAWELRGGLRGLNLYVRAIVLSGVAAGVLVAPRRTLRAWRASSSRNLFDADGYEELLDLPLSELRARLGVPEGGLAQVRGLHAGAPRTATPRRHAPA